MDRDNKREITISFRNLFMKNFKMLQNNYPDGNMNSSREQNVRYLIHGNRRMW